MYLHVSTSEAQPDTDSGAYASADVADKVLPNSSEPKVQLFTQDTLNGTCLASDLVLLMYYYRRSLYGDQSSVYDDQSCNVVQHMRQPVLFLTVIAGSTKTTVDTCSMNNTNT